MPIDRLINLVARWQAAKRRYDAGGNATVAEAFAQSQRLALLDEELLAVDVAALGAEAEPPWPAELKALYDATSVLQAVLNFTSDTADLLSEEMDYATRLLMTVRSRIRDRFGVEIDTPAALIKPVEILGKFAARRLPSPPSSGREEQA